MTSLPDQIGRHIQATLIRRHRGICSKTYTLNIGGQIVGLLRYERMADAPQTLYGQAIKSNYQGQSLKLAKQFRPA